MIIISYFLLNIKKEVKMLFNDYEKYINEIDKILEDNNTFNKEVQKVWTNLRRLL